MRNFKERKGRLFLLLAAAMLLSSLTVLAGAADASTPANTPSNGNQYFLLVNRQANTVTVYTLDEAGYYSVPIKAMICSTGRSGHSTPLFDKTLPGWKKRWCYMVDGSYGQYATEIDGNYLFHSVCYSASRSDSLMEYEYNDLGEVASLGCVRLQVADAKWIYDNCPAGTRVAIYDSPDPGPLGKPAKAVSAVAAGTGWDPTDPAEGNPWKSVNAAVDSAGGGTVSGGGYVLSGGSITVTAVPEGSNRFDGWYGEDGTLLSTAPDCTLTVWESQTLTARFSGRYALDLTAEGNGTVSRSFPDAVGDDVILTAAPGEGSRFAGWYGPDGKLLSDQNPCFLTLTEDTSVTGRFLSQVQIDAVATRSGTVTGAGTYDEGAEVTLTAVPAQGGTFDCWRDENGKTLSTDPAYTFTAQGNTTLYAIFGGDKFIDIPAGIWYASYVTEAVDRGLVTGMTPLTFEADLHFTRAMAAAMFSRLDGADTAASPAAPFTDVVAGSWYAGPVNWAYDHQVIRGRTETLFDPEADITRQEFFTMAIRYLSARGFDLKAADLPFPDQGDISPFALEPVKKAYGIGMVAGYSDGTLQPLNPLTRAEGTTLMVRIARYLDQQAQAEVPEAPETPETP